MRVPIEHDVTASIYNIIFTVMPFHMLASLLLQVVHCMHVYTVPRLTCASNRLLKCLFIVQRLSTCSRKQNVACLLCDACPHTRASNCMHVHRATFGACATHAHLFYQCLPPCRFGKVVHYSTFAYDFYSHASARY